ncbi:unnamed protein product [Brassica napus]|uniref:(rape) hypothetical protein n=1 Tax=Brassica napus TaxID=3708 RepID=A0A816UQU7_BRANA|nr:unnamed protein product [Brassica napus]
MSGEVIDARVWMGAALAYHYDFLSGLKTGNNTKQLVNTITLNSPDFLESLRLRSLN